MRYFVLAITFLVANCVFGETDALIIAENTQAVVYLQVEDPAGGVVNRGTGFIVSSNGYVVTAAHLKVEQNQGMWAVIGQRQGTRFRLDFREADETNDVALWQLPQSSSCYHSVTLTTAPVAVLDHALALGFPGNGGLTPTLTEIANLTSPLGFYKADGYLQPGNSGGPVFNKSGKVIAIVQGGTLPGTNNNDMVPIAPAISLLQRRGVQIGFDSPAPCKGSISIMTWYPTGDVSIDAVQQNLDNLGPNPTDAQLVQTLRPLFTQPVFQYIGEELPETALYRFCRSRRILGYYSNSFSNPQIRKAALSGVQNLIYLQDIVGDLYGQAFVPQEHCDSYHESEKEFTSALPQRLKNREAIQEKASKVLNEFRITLRSVGLMD